MIIYPDTEKELFLTDYKPLTDIRLIELSVASLEQLLNNLEQVADNAFIYHSDLLYMAILPDIEKVSRYLKMKQKKAARKEG